MALTAPTFQQLIARASDRPDELTLVGPASARSFVASALAQQGPLLVVTATGREADDVTAELRGVFGEAVALFPSWETLPHERLSPGVDTVGARLLLLRRLAHPDDTRLGPPLRVVVTAVRSLLQPMTPQLGRQEPVSLSVGQEIGFDEVIARLVELAYTRVDMVGRRGEFAVRGAFWTSSRRPPSTRCGSNSGATRSPKCACSRSPTSAPFPRSRSARWSRWPAGSCF
ncbi:transcription-repair-coupling factor domain protein [Mycobacterium ulcerans str. Harvey]|uniref:Transcription-repair-coupling factor domain protein n=1 Tax=Mycobacterium ulcerans str. Harvey TaxID=1299332 RepID=A0ABP3A382_MYCUL|nr:transcription-repair-coupling factor domain protein [Mycobacterium ulcerans str. Harvey]